MQWPVSTCLLSLSLSLFLSINLYAMISMMTMQQLFCYKRPYQPAFYLAKLVGSKCQLIMYFLKYNVHMSIVSAHLNFTMIFCKKIIFFKNNFPRINHCKIIHHKSQLKPFLGYLPCIVCKKYFSIIFNV